MDGKCRSEIPQELLQPSCYYDFYISQPECIQALEGYREMEERMTDIKNSLTDTIDRTKIYWVGKAHTEVEDELKKLLNKGTFHTAYKKIKAVSGCLAAFLPEINALLTRCEGFAEQLQYNSCIEPHKPAEGDNTVHNDGILALNYSYVSCIAETCDEILEENEQITSILSDVINDCRTLLDGTNEDMERLALASNKVKRMERRILRTYG